MADKDVEMKTLTLDTDVSAAKEKEKEKEAPPKLTPNQEIKENVAMIQRGVSSMEPRFAHRVLRTLTGMRKTLTAEVVARAIDENLVKGNVFLNISLTS
jgi:26S proteasome regulatory subunit N3